MSLVSLNEVLLPAQKSGYAVGAFNINNLEAIQAIMEASEAEKAPIIIQASKGAIRYMGVEYAAALGHTAASLARFPVVLHLDHGQDFSIVMECIRNGFSSVMFDGSRLPLEENIAETRRVVEAAHAVGVSVEGELGHIGDPGQVFTDEDRQKAFTKPAEAARFVEETDVDALAIAIGTVHGPYKGEPELDFDLLEEIKKAVGIPLVLHGASGLTNEDLKKAISLGICKVNINTDFMQAFTSRMRNVLEEDREVYDPRKICGPAREAMVEVMRERIRVLGSSNKA